MAKIMEEENASYEAKAIHKEIVEKVEKLMPKEEIIYDLADFFKILGDTTRMRILSALFHEEMCVYDIANLENDAVCYLTSASGIKTGKVCKT